MSLYTSFNYNIEGTGHEKEEFIMTKQELFEEEYILNDAKYLEICRDEAESYYIEKEMKRDNSCWLFERPRNYQLEDPYDEDSMP